MSCKATVVRKVKCLSLVNSRKSILGNGVLDEKARLIYFESFQRKIISCSKIM